jgi:FecR-like protein
MTGARSLRLKHRLAGASAAALLGLSFACAYAIGPAEADKVGVAAAVNPDAFSSLAGAPQSQLSIGKSIFYNERINTTGSGLVQVLLVDGSTFTVGPGSDLVIDKFVYDPKKGTGQLAASFSKGVMRFVGGKLSKNDPGVKVNTPAGALTVRGGIFTAKISGSNKALITFDYGISLSILRHGQLQITRVAGDVISINGAGPAVIRSQTMADVNATQGAVAGKGWKKTASNTGKKKGWPYYYGIQPTGRYPDQPFVKELYYDGATTQILLNGLTRVPPPPPPPPPPQTIPDLHFSVGPNALH